MSNIELNGVSCRKWLKNRKKPRWMSLRWIGKDTEMQVKQICFWLNKEGRSSRNQSSHRQFLTVPRLLRATWSRSRTSCKHWTKVRRGVRTLTDSNPICWGNEHRVFLSLRMQKKVSLHTSAKACQKRKTPSFWMLTRLTWQIRRQTFKRSKKRTRLTSKSKTRPWSISTAKSKSLDAIK